MSGRADVTYERFDVSKADVTPVDTGLSFWACVRGSGSGQMPVGRHSSDQYSPKPVYRAGNRLVFGLADRVFASPAQNDLYVVPEDEFWALQGEKSALEALLREISSQDGPTDAKNGHDGTSEAANGRPEAVSEAARLENASKRAFGEKNGRRMDVVEPGVRPDGSQMALF